MHDTVFLFDIDNTLFDNDRLTADLRAFLEREIGGNGAGEYWKIFEELRASLGYADYLGTLQEYRRRHPQDVGILCVSRFLLGYPFPDRVFPGALAAVAHAVAAGPAVVLSDGDVVFQPHKALRSGIAAAVSGRELIYVHKEAELADVERRYPAKHYVMIDDKLRLLDAIKRVWGARVTTVFVRQGHYALDPKLLAAYPPADVTLETIGDFSKLDLVRLP